METATQERQDLAAGTVAQQRAAQITTQPLARRIDPMQMVQTAIDKDMDPQRLKDLMDLAERQQANIARQEFSLAMACFKAEAPRLVKNKNVHFRSSKGVTNYNHATLDYILKQVCPVMSKYGLSHQWFNLQEGGSIGVRCRLSHVLGHFEEVALWGPADNSGNKNGIQAIGSTTTYLQRYTFLSITGLATEENPDEDDGYAAGEPQQQAGQRENQQAERTSQKRPYPQERFESKLETFRQAVLTGKRTPQEIIDTIESSAQMSEEQKQVVLNIGAGA